MRIALPLSFWVALALNLEHVDAFTPPHLWSPFVGSGGVGDRRENADLINNPLTDDVNLSRPSPFYFATRLGGSKSDSNNNSNNTKFSQPEIDRARTQYLDWCSEYRKTPDDKRFLQFMENFLVMERMARKQGTQIKLNEYADYTAAEYQQKMKKKSGGSSSAGSVGDGSSATKANASAAQTNKNLNLVETDSDVVKKSPAGEAAAKAQVAAQAASEAVAAAKKEVVAATKAAAPATPAPSAGDGSPAGTNVSVGDPAKILAQQQAAEAERKRLELVAKAEAAQRAEAERARVRAAEAKAKRDAELAAKRAVAEKERAEQERQKQEALAAQRAKMEEMERKRREAVARAEEAQRADAARARARAEKEEQERREREQAVAAAARAKAEEEEAKRRKAQEEEDRLRKEREEAAAKARAAVEAAERAKKRAEEELQLKKEQEEREALEAKRKAAEAAEEARKRAEEEQRLKKVQEERKAAEAKRKAAELERLAKERQVLLSKKKEREEGAKRELEEARLKQQRETEAKREAAQTERRRLEHERKAKEVQAASAKAKAGQESTDRSNRVTVAKEVAEKPQKEKEQSSSMSKAQSDSKGKQADVTSIQSWWNSIRDVTSATSSRKRQRRGALSSDGNNLDGKTPAVQARVKTLYLEWCQTYGKKPDDSRFPRFMERFLLIEQFALEQDVEITLNEYADCTEEEYKKDTKRTESKASAPSSSQQSPLADTKNDLVTNTQATQDQEMKTLEARTADLKKSEAQVSEDTTKLLTNLARAQSKLEDMEQALANERSKERAKYVKQQKDAPTADPKENAVEEAERLKEQRALAAKRKVEEEKRKREELEAKQNAELAAKKKADSEKRRQESIARARRKAEEEMLVKTVEADAAAEKQAREKKRQKEIATKAKAAAAAAKKIAEQKRQKETAVSNSASEVNDPDDKIPDSEAMKELIDESEKSIDEQLAEVASRIEELQRMTDDVEDDKKAPDQDIATKSAPDTKTDSVDASSKGDASESDEADATKALSKEEEKTAAEAKKKAEEEELRIRSAYLDWCIAFSKKPDMARIKQFKQNYLLIEEYAKEKGTEIKLNEYADCTAAEYERAMKAKEEAKKKEEEKQRKREEEEEEAAAYKAAVGEVSDQFGMEGNKTAISTDEPSDFESEENAVAAGDPNDVWKTGEPTMSMWEPESDESMWASEGGTSLWESDEWGEIDESYAAVGTVDPDDPEVRKRVRSAYSNWCKEYNKEPDEGRFPRFKSNYLKMEQVAWEQGREITLNEFADCSPEEYRLALDNVPMEEEERLERLRLEQEEEAKLAVARGREDRIERLRREQEEEAARLAAKRKVEPAWKIEAPKRRVLENFRVDWEEDEKAALEEVERIALAKAEAAARRVEAARKKNDVEKPNDRTTIRSNSIDVDRQLRQKALDERHKQEQAKLEEEFFAKAEAKQAEEDRLQREWEQSETERGIRVEEERQIRINEDRQRKARMDASKAEGERRAADKAANELKRATAKPEPSPAFNLGSVFGTRKNGSSPLPPLQKGPGPGQPVVKPPGSFAPRVKKPAHGNSEWQQDDYAKNYDPTSGSGYDRNGVGDQLAVPPSPPPTDDSYFLDFSDGPGAQVSSPDMASPGNKEWYEENLSQSRVRPPPTESQRGSFSQGVSMGSRPSSAEVAPDEVDLDASSRFKSYLDNLSAAPKDRGASSQPPPMEDSQPYSPPPPPPTPAVSPPSSRNGANYLENLQSQFPERIESAYRDWCQYYGKEASEDRLRIFATNFLAVEKYHRETGVSLILNELADMTSDEFKNGKGGP